jgi:hypothetical protein
MVVVQRGRFTEWLKNLTGLRGPYSVDLDKGIAPVYDLANSDTPELDQDKAWWFTSQQFLVASPGNFTSFAVRTASLKCRVTNVIIGATAAQQTYLLGLIADPGVGAVPCTVANDFLGSRGAVYTLAQNNFGPVTMFSRQTAASILVNTNQFAIAPPAGQDFIFPFRLPFIIQPGWAFAVETSVVNQAARVSFIGEALADQT